MVEALLAKLLEEDNYEQLLRQHVASLLEMTKLPPVALDNLHLLSQVLNKDLKGQATFNAVLKQLASAKKEPIIRVLDSHENGQKLVQALSDANSSLQDAFEKQAKVAEAITTLKGAASIAKFGETVLEVAKLASEDHKSDSLCQDFKSVASLLQGKVGTVSQESGQQGLEPFLRNLQQAHVDEAATQAFFSSEAVQNLRDLSDLLKQKQVLTLLKMGSEHAETEASHLLALQRFVPRLVHPCEPCSSATCSCPRKPCLLAICNQ